MKRNDKIIRYAFVSIFSLLLVLPGIMAWIHFGDDETVQQQREQRRLTRFPAREYSYNYLHDFGKWFDDHYGFREDLISTNSDIKINLFKTPADAEKVSLGNDGWFFYNGANNDDFIFASYTHADLLTREGLDLYCSDLRKREDQLKRSGIVYIKGFFPQTHTIYPEKMPVLMRLQIKDTISKADQIIQALAQRMPHFKFIDPRPELLQAKKKHQLYQKLDTHWNDYGAFIGYQALLNQSFSRLGVKPHAIEEYKIVMKDTTFGDLVLMLGSKALFHDERPVFIPLSKTISYHEMPSGNFPMKTVYTMNEKAKDRRRVLVFRDSYSTNIIPFLSPHFYEIIWLRSAYDDHRVTEYKPDVVLDLSAERYLQ